jgi:hypothetical protein
MPTLKKLTLLERLNNAFIEEGNGYIDLQYYKYFRKIERDLSEKEKLNKKDIDEVVSYQNLQYNTMTKTMSAILLADIQETRNRNQDTEALMLAYYLVKRYKKPETIARVVNEQFAMVNQGLKPSIPQFLEYANKNDALIKKVDVKAQRQIAFVNSQIKSDLSKQMLRQFNDYQKQGLNKQEILDKFKVQFKDNVARAKRIVRTEMHLINETAKVERSKSRGYTHKQWRTQGDDRVRSTAWHDVIDGVKVEIDKSFEAIGLSADSPGDLSLPIEERINCRCYLVFTRESDN